MAFKVGVSLGLVRPRPTKRRRVQNSNLKRFNAKNYAKLLLYRICSTESVAQQIKTEKNQNE